MLVLIFVMSLFALYSTEVNECDDLEQQTSVSFFGKMDQQSSRINFSQLDLRIDVQPSQSRDSAYGKYIQILFSFPTIFSPFFGVFRLLVPVWHLGSSGNLFIITFFLFALTHVIIELYLENYYYFCIIESSLFLFGVSSQTGKILI